MTIIQYILLYKYLIIIPFAIIEGPFLTVICGFLVAGKLLNPWIVLPILIVGDIFGDGIIYWAGRTGNWALRLFRVNEKNLEDAKKYFHENHKKALITSKLVHGLGFTGLLAAGAVRVPYRRYFLTCATISTIQSSILLTLGIVFASAYLKVGQYLNYYAAAVSAIAVIVIGWLIFRYYQKKKKLTFKE
jgi:membrane protein DedA with SNARE-associated domain